MKVVAVGRRSWFGRGRIKEGSKRARLEAETGLAPMPPLGVVPMEETR